VVMTGAGPVITVPGQPGEHPRVLDGRTYWLAAGGLHRDRALNLCVAGSGESAAWVVTDLVKRCRRHPATGVLTARGVLYSRGEGYEENRFSSDPAPRPRPAEAHRREFPGRTDRGVFSLQAEAALNQARGVRTLAGRAAAVEAREHDAVMTIACGDEPAGHGGARAGARVPGPQLSRPAERPHPPPPCRGQRRWSTGTGKQGPCLNTVTTAGTATTACTAPSCFQVTLPSGSPPRPRAAASR
jgi:hypothetical protein